MGRSYGAVLLLIASTAASASMEANFGSAVEWTSPLAGKHRLSGDDGCENITLSLDGNASPTTRIRIELVASSGVVYRRELTASVKFDSINARQLNASSEDFLFSDPPRVHAVEMEKDSDGKLKALSIADWRKYFKLATYWSLKCYAR